MARPDVFAMNHSDLNAFLFADVGEELNGSRLTILSVLARLGEDPWAEAARWAALPRAKATECLAQCIARMPMSPRALSEASETAARLAQLLPGQRSSAPAMPTKAPFPGAFSGAFSGALRGGASDGKPRTRATTVLAIGAAIAAGLGFAMLMMH